MRCSSNSGVLAAVFLALACRGAAFGGLQFPMWGFPEVQQPQPPQDQPPQAMAMPPQQPQDQFPQPQFPQPPQQPQAAAFPLPQFPQWPQPPQAAAFPQAQFPQAQFPQAQFPGPQPPPAQFPQFQFPQPQFPQFPPPMPMEQFEPTRPPNPDKQRFQQSVQQAQQLTAGIHDIQLQMSDLPRNIREVQEETALLKQKAELRRQAAERTKPQIAKVQEQLGAVYNELQDNLAAGRPRPITELRLKKDMEEMMRDYDIARTKDADKKQRLQDLTAENEKLRGEIAAYVPPPPQAAAVTETERVYQQKMGAHWETQKLLAENEGLAKSNKDKLDRLNSVVNPIGSAAVAKTNAMHMTSAPCEPTLQAEKDHLGKQQLENEQLQARLSVLQSDAAQMAGTPP